MHACVHEQHETHEWHACMNNMNDMNGMHACWKMNNMDGMHDDKCHVPSHACMAMHTCMRDPCMIHEDQPCSPPHCPERNHQSLHDSSPVHVAKLWWTLGKNAIAFKCVPKHDKQHNTIPKNKAGNGTSPSSAYPKSKKVRTAESLHLQTHQAGSLHPQLLRRQHHKPILHLNLPLTAAAAPTASALAAVGKLFNVTSRKLKL